MVALAENKFEGNDNTGLKQIAETANARVRSEQVEVCIDPKCETAAKYKPQLS